MTPRRSLLALSPALLLAACASGGTTGGGTSNGVSVPTLADVQNWANSLIPQLPVMVDALATTGVLVGAAYTKAQQAAADAQQLLPQISALTPNEDWRTIVKQVLNTVMLIAALIPASAPYVPVIMLFVSVLNATLLQQPVTGANGAPVPVPAPPTAATFAAMHHAAMMRHR